MRNLVDNMDLVEAAVEAVREPVFVETDEYKAFFLNIENTLDVLLKVINSQAEEIVLVKKGIDAAHERINNLVGLIHNNNRVTDFLPQPNYRNQMQQLSQQQVKSIAQPMNINWDAVFGDANVNTQPSIKG
jgi:hypothetical protein